MSVRGVGVVGVVRMVVVMEEMKKVPQIQLAAIGVGAAIQILRLLR